MFLCVASIGLLAFTAGMLVMALLLRGRGPIIREDEL